MALDPRVQVRLEAALHASAFEVPVLDEAVMRLLVEVRKPDADIAKVSAIVRRDPALAGNLLRLANASTFAGREPIATLQHAVSRLGLDAICELALVVAAKTRAFRVKGREAEMKKMFAQSFATALYAQEIARTRKLGVEQAFLVGLFHDVGKPPVIQLAIDLCTQQGVDVDEEEVTATVEKVHAEVGARMVEAWQLGAAVADGVRFHHRFDPGVPSHRSAALAAIADVLAAIALGEADSDAVAGHPALAPLGLYPDDVAKLIERGPKIATHVAEAA